MKLCARMWGEESGAIVSAEIMLVSSVLVIGSVVGLKSVRDSVVTELADVAQALANVDQSFSYSGVVGHHAFSGGGAFFDMPDFCDLPGDFPAQQSKCVAICAAWAHPAGFGADGAGGGWGWGGTGGAVVPFGARSSGNVRWSDDHHRGHHGQPVFIDHHHGVLPSPVHGVHSQAVPVGGHSDQP